MVYSRCVVLTDPLFCGGVCIEDIDSVLICSAVLYVCDLCVSILTSEVCMCVCM